jgi:hypothetical protein
MRISLGQLSLGEFQLGFAVLCVGNDSG